MVIRMTKCEKCIHGDICATRDCMDADDEIAMTYCAYFIGKADFAEVVRCDKCEHWIYWADEKRCSCDLHHIRTNRDDFCSYGERKEGAKQ